MLITPIQEDTKQGSLFSLPSYVSDLPILPGETQDFCKILLRCRTPEW